MSTQPLIDDVRQRPVWWRRRRVLLTAGGIAAAVVAVGLVWFQPQKLFIDEKVDEAAPAVSDAMPNGDKMMGKTSDDTMPASDLRGSFESLAHPTMGRAIVKELADGSCVLRLEDFETSNGPDVRVYLSAGPKDAYGKEFVDLGGLKGNVGNQNYTIPSGTDLDRYDTAVIWCRRFTVAFAAATLRA